MPKPDKPLPAIAIQAALTNPALRQRDIKFVTEFVRSGGDALTAFKAANFPESAYNCKTKIDKFIAKSKIHAAICELEEQSAIAAGYTIERAIYEEMERLAVDVSEMFDDFGDMLPLREWPKALRLMVKGVEITENKDGSRKIKVQLMDKDKAADRLHRMCGFNRDRLEMSGTVEHVYEVAALVESLQGTALRPALPAAKNLQDIEDAVYTEIEEPNND